jgi:hypothetical protein
MNDAKMTSDSSVVFGTGGWCFPPNCLCIDVFGGLTSVISSDGLFATCGTRSIYTLPSCSQSIYAVGGWQNAVLAGTDYGIEKFSWTDSVWARTSPLHSSRIRLIKEAAGMMIAASLHELFVSFDRGSSWKQRVTPSATDSVNAIAGINGTIIAGTPGGVFYSRDSGATWSALATPFYSAGILDLAIINTTLFAGTNGAGVYMTDVKDIIGSTNLSGRHPQSPSLRIARVRQSAGVVEYAVTTEQAQPLTVRVFDGLGRTLYQKEYGAAGGPSTIAIPRGRLPRGLCFVQIGTAAGRNIFKECLVNGK